jgi:hypothetical protein
MLPLPVTVIAPPLLKIGPEVGVAMICADGTRAACATPDAPSTTSAKAEAPASSAVRETGSQFGLARSDACFGPPPAAPG